MPGVTTASAFASTSWVLSKWWTAPRGMQSASPGPTSVDMPSRCEAYRLRISKQALNYLLGELERLDYLERRPDPDDLRTKRVALTRRGTSAVGVIREAVGEVEAAWGQQLGPERFAQLRNLLLELNQLA